jgi:CRISP-associated protein Cas1
MSQTNRKSEETGQNAGDDLWSERGEYWLKKLNPVSQYKARKRRVIHRPLVLSGHGIRLNIDRGSLLIKCGFTHYPQAREEYRLFPQDRQLPSRIVILDGDGGITFDALSWLSQQNVPLVQIDWQGQLSSIGGAPYAASADLVTYQREALQSGHGFAFAQELIQQKIVASQETIRLISDRSPETDLILEKIEIQAKSLRDKPPQNVASLLAIEAIAAAAYFRYWYTLSLKWKGINKKPIPPEWHQIGSRIGNSKSNQFALHPVNAILNYAYAILEHEVCGHILAYGADPTIGYLHANEPGRHALVFDLMEPLRPIMDRKVLKFVLEHTFCPDDFILNKNGICRLHPQFARCVVKAVQDIPEIETITNMNLKRLFSPLLNAKRPKKVPLQLIK